MLASAQHVELGIHDFRPKDAYHRALLARLSPPGQTAWQLAHAHPIPNLDQGQVLIKTTFVALNPFDWQGVAFKFGIGPEAKVMGRDGAGVVVGIGTGVSRFKLGDRVWFCANTSGTGTGAFQEYSVHSSTDIGHTPNNVSDEAAATLGTGLITAGVALFRTLGLPLIGLFDQPQSSKSAQAPWILIWGGSGITGVFLIQLAHYLGYRVICAASPGNFEHVKSLGADVVLDRWADGRDLVEEIRTATNDTVRIAIDNVGSSTAGLCRQVLQGSSTWRTHHGLPSTDDDLSPGRLVPIAGSPSKDETDTDAVRTVKTLRISFSTTFFGHPEFSEVLLDAFTSLLANEHILPARIKFVEGGLYGIEKGLEDLRQGRVPGGYKLVARLADTPIQ